MAERISLQLTAVINHCHRITLFPKEAIFGSASKPKRGREVLIYSQALSISQSSYLSLGWLATLGYSMLLNVRKRDYEVSLRASCSPARKSVTCSPAFVQS
jgi:hypothetical protein